MESPLLEVVGNQLIVVNFDGGPRTGKGSMAHEIADRIPGATSDETGAYYRTITHRLFEAEQIDPDMTVEQIHRVVGSISQGDITDYAGSRAELDDDQLYRSLIHDFVGKVSTLETVRIAVKNGLTKRIERLVADKSVHLLAVDGRNLPPVIRKVDGAELILRLFVNCQSQVAAVRELTRNGIDPAKPENETLLHSTAASLEERQRLDEERTTDAVKKEPDSIDYWHNRGILKETAHRNASRLGTSPGQMFVELSDAGRPEFYATEREGVGALAYATNRQIYLDTTHMGFSLMKGSAVAMVREALDQREGVFQPMTGLIPVTN